MQPEVPEHDPPVVEHRRDHGPIRNERQRHDARPRLEVRRLLAPALRVPHPHRPVARAAGEQPRVGRERKRRDDRSMSVDVELALFDLLVVALDELLAVGADPDAEEDARGVALAVDRELPVLLLRRESGPRPLDRPARPLLWGGDDRDPWDDTGDRWGDEDGGYDRGGGRAGPAAAPGRPDAEPTAAPAVSAGVHVARSWLAAHARMIGSGVWSRPTSTARTMSRAGSRRRRPRMISS